jgi:ubiquinone/menaquinone biosynthesis C-methylase UbiE
MGDSPGPESGLNRSARYEDCEFHAVAPVKAHPLFARVYERRSPKIEHRGMREHRLTLLAGLSGIVLEVGVGNGLNLPHYPARARHVIAVEPDPYLLAQASGRANDSVTTVSMVRGDVNRLPFPEASIEAVVCSLVLCSVPSPDRALTEVRRVLRPGGQLRFFEHVSANAVAVRRVQWWIDPFWSRFVGGCTLTRDTEKEIRNCGFEVERCTRFHFRPTFTAFVTSPHITGTASR